MLRPSAVLAAAVLLLPRSSEPSPVRRKSRLRLRAAKSTILLLFDVIARKEQPDGGSSLTCHGGISVVAFFVDAHYSTVIIGTVAFFCS